MPGMSDLPTVPAWRVPPQDYFATRPAEHALPAAPRSRYVAMADGVRIALDVHLPDDDADRRWPAILLFTPYYRRFKLAEGTPATVEARKSAAAPT